jgi:transposase-like protein
MQKAQKTYTPQFKREAVRLAQTAQEEELRRLKRELDRVQKERDILKKTDGVSSRETRCEISVH